MSRKYNEWDGSAPQFESSIHLDVAAPLFQLVYFSTSLIPPFDIGGDKEIESILHIATERNSRQNVTGALTYNDLYFAQVLEGPHHAVNAVMESIRRDSRHIRIVVLQSGVVAARDFSAWAMGYVADASSMRLISPNMSLKDVLSKERPAAALALVEMMKFWLLRQS